MLQSLPPVARERFNSLFEMPGIDLNELGHQLSYLFQFSV